MMMTNNRILVQLQCCGKEEKEHFIKKMFGVFIFIEDTGVARWVPFVSAGMGECQSEDSFVCFGAKPTQKACTRGFLRERKKMPTNKVPGQSAEVEEIQRSEKGGCRERSLSLYTRRPGRPNESACLVAVSEFRDSHRFIENHTIVSIFFPFCAFCSSLLPLSRLCMLCLVCL